MAFDQLDLYNDALLLLGQRKLANLTENREPRYRLDGAFNRAGIEYCLELVRPQFANRTVTLDGGSAGANFDHDLDLPADYISMVGLYSDAGLDQEVNRYTINGRVLSTDHATVYLRYTSSVAPIGEWDPSFGRVVGAYLARETAVRLSPEAYDVVELKFKERVESAKTIAANNAPARRPVYPVSTLSAVWLRIYNDALQIMGLEPIILTTDDSHRRVTLDRVFDSGIVADILEDTSWQFGFESAEIDFDPSAEPDFGHDYAIRKPLNIHRLQGIWSDEYMTVKVNEYSDETDYWFCSYDKIYCTYISTDYLAMPDMWPTFFRRLVAARAAKDGAATLRPDMIQHCNAVFDDRESNAKSIDAMGSPPHIIRDGNWTRSRFVGGRRGRP